jgi:hypothetical protein
MAAKTDDVYDCLNDDWLHEVEVFVMRKTKEEKQNLKKHGTKEKTKNTSAAPAPERVSLEADKRVLEDVGPGRPLDGLLRVLVEVACVALVLDFGHIRRRDLLLQQRVPAQPAATQHRGR